MTTIPTDRTETSGVVRRQRRHVILTLVWLLSLASIIPTASAAPGSGKPPIATQSQPNGFPARSGNADVRVYDTVDILTDDQEDSFNKDLARADRLGVEMLIYTRRSADSPEQSQAFADDLRTNWSVESSSGADDGIVYLVTVNPAARETNAVVISTGENTFPIRQLDQSELQRVLDDEMMSQIDDGEFNQALLFGVRRVINAAEYSPPNPSPLSSLQKRLHAIAFIVSTALLQIAVIGYFLVAVIRERRLTWLPGPGSLVIYAIVLGTMAVLAGVVAIAGHNAFGSLAALGVFVWAAGGVPLLIGLANSRRRQSGSVRVPQRRLDSQSSAGRQAGAPAIGQQHG